MGQIDSSPRFKSSTVYEIKSSSSETIFTVEISHYERLKEDGAKDPTRPGGPDNRNIITVTGYDVYFRDRTGEMVSPSSMPEEFSKFATELSEKYRSEAQGPVAGFDIVSWAKSEFSLLLTKK